MSSIHPMTGQRYGWARKTSASSCSSIRPKIEFSVRSRRSSFTTSRSCSSASSVIRSDRIRSDSRSTTVPRASEAKSS